MKLIEAVFIKPTDVGTSQFEAATGLKVCLSGGGSYDRIFGVRVEDRDAEATAAKIREAFPGVACNVIQEGD